MKPNQLMIFALLTLICLQFSGCGDPNRSRLIGTWNIAKPERVAGRLSDETAENDSTIDQTEMDLPPKMQIQFLRNGGLATITQMGTITPSPKQGSWQMLEFDESTKTMKIQCQIGLQETEHEVQFLDANTIKLVPPNMAGLSLKLKFERQ